MNDHYKILGVDQTASDETIKEAYKKLAKIYHPDKNKDPKVVNKFKDITDSYTTLSDPIKRKEYDSKTSFQGDFHMWGDVLNPKKSGRKKRDFMDRPMRTEPPKGSDLKIRLKLTLEEIYKGTTKTVNLKRLVHCPSCDSSGAKTNKPCSTCHGKGIIMQMNESSGSFGEFMASFDTKTCPTCYGSCIEADEECYYCNGAGTVLSEEKVDIRVSRGIANEETIKVPNKGNAGKLSGRPGDLYVVIEEITDDNFERKGLDLIKTVNFNISDLVLGTTSKVSTIDGKTIELKIPAGSDSGKMFRIKQGGLIKDNPYNKEEIGEVGHFFVKLNVIIPKNLTEEQEELFKKIRDIEQSVSF